MRALIIFFVFFSWSGLQAASKAKDFYFELKLIKKHGSPEVSVISNKDKLWHCETENGSTGWLEDMFFKKVDLVSLVKQNSDSNKNLTTCPGDIALVIDKSQGNTESFQFCSDRKEVQGFVRKVDKLCLR